jgi:hypothetical protein
VYIEARTVLRAVVTDFALTVCVWRSLRITAFGTYQGASEIVRKTLDWKRSRVSIFENSMHDIAILCGFYIR